MFNPVLSRRDIQWLVRGETNAGLAGHLGSWWQMALFEAQEPLFDEVPTTNSEKQRQRKGENKQ